MEEYSLQYGDKGRLDPNLLPPTHFKKRGAAVHGDNEFIAALYAMPGTANNDLSLFHTLFDQKFLEHFDLLHGTPAPGRVLVAFCIAIFLALYFDVLPAQDDITEFRLAFAFPSKQKGWL